MSTVISLDKKGRTTLPEEVRSELGLKAGDFVILERTERGTFELVPASLVPNDQLWFYHPEMQRRIRDAEASIASGHATRTEGLAAVRRHLDSLKRPVRRARRPRPARSSLRAGQKG
jgi:AbrB family looped-hinge helix DNA binding protein